MAKENESEVDQMAELQNTINTNNNMKKKQANTDAEAEGYYLLFQFL